MRSSQPSTEAIGSPLLQTPPNHVSRLKAGLSAAWNSRAASYAGFGLNAAYTGITGLLFASFAQRHGDYLLSKIGYAVCSAFVNLPMSWLFAERAYKAFTRLFQNLLLIYSHSQGKEKDKKVEKIYIAAFFLAFILAAGTTSSAYQVAVESATGSPWFSYFGKNAVKIATYSSLFNTFSTRFVGSVNLLYTLGHWLFDLYQRRRHGAYYLLLEDIRQHGQSANVVLDNYGQSKTQLIYNYSNQFYAGMKQKGLRPGSSWKQWIKNTAISLATLSILALIMWNMMPLWLQLTVEGARKISNIKISEALSNSPAFIWYAASSSELFYLNSGRTFVPNALDFVKYGSRNIAKKFENQKKKLITASIAFGLAISLLAVIDYYSGGGYGKDGADAMVYGFDKMVDTLWFSWMGWYTNLFLGHYDVLASTAAGVIVNGGSFFNFCVSKIPFFQGEKSIDDQHHDSRKITTLLEKMIEEDRFEELDKEGVRQHIDLSRTQANPQKSLWSSLWSRCQSSTSEEKEPLSLNRINGYQTNGFDV